MNQPQALFQLQTIDHDIQQCKSRLTVLEQSLGENTRVRNAEQAVASAEDALTPLKTQVKDLELETKSLNTKAAAVEQRLYSGQVSNPKELQDMQEELASLKRRRTSLEDEMLETMITLESTQATLQDAQESLRTAIAEWEADQGDLVGEQTRLTASLDELRAKRATALKEVSPENFSIYKKHYRIKQGQVVSPLVETHCRVCGVSQSSSIIQQVRQGHELVFCSNCGRILAIV